MSDLQELQVLLLELIDKHPNINNTYSLTRFFGKSSVLPGHLYTTLKGLVAQGYIEIGDIKNTINFYQLSPKGQGALESIDVFDFVSSYAVTIDETRFIAKIVFLLENKNNSAEVMESYKLSDGRLIAFISSKNGKLEDFSILEDMQKKRWQIKAYLTVYGNPESYERIKRQESENTFQYLLEGIKHADKPLKGDYLKVYKNIS